VLFAQLLYANGRINVFQREVFDFLQVEFQAALIFTKYLFQIVGYIEELLFAAHALI